MLARRRTYLQSRTYICYIELWYVTIETLCTGSHLFAVMHPKFALKEDIIVRLKKAKSTKKLPAQLRVIPPAIMQIIATKKRRQFCREPEILQVL